MNALVLNYNPYKWDSENECFEGATGVEWDFNKKVSEQFDQIIDYDDYASCDFSIYWNNFKNKFKEIKHTNSTDTDSTDTDSTDSTDTDLVNIDLIDTDLLHFKKCAKDLYDQQLSNKTQGNYYFYILVKNIITQWNTIYSKGLTDEQINILSSTGEDGVTYSRQAYISVSETDITSIDTVLSTDVKNYNLRYHEIKWMDQDIHPRITKINITGPVGTMFFLNNIFRPLYISDWAKSYSPSLLQGVFDLDTNNTMILNKITFPKAAAPIFKLPDEDGTKNEYLNISKAEMEKTQITVIIYYEIPNE